MGCQMKVCDVPHQFWFQKSFPKQQTKPLNSSMYRFGSFRPFLATFGSIGHLIFITDQCKWYQMKANDVPNQFRFQKSFSKQQKKPLNSSMYRFFFFQPFLATFGSIVHLIFIKDQCKWYQMKACDVPHQFWLQKSFPNQ